MLQPMEVCMSRKYSVSIVATNCVSVKASSEDEAAERRFFGSFETLDGADYDVVSISWSRGSAAAGSRRKQNPLGFVLRELKHSRGMLTCRCNCLRTTPAKRVFVTTSAKCCMMRMICSSNQIPDDCDEKVELLKIERAQID